MVEVGELHPSPHATHRLQIDGRLTQCLLLIKQLADKLGTTLRVVVVEMIEIGIRRGHIEIIAHGLVRCGRIVIIELQQGIGIVGQIDVGDGTIHIHRFAS